MRAVHSLSHPRLAPNTLSRLHPLVPAPPAALAQVLAVPPLRPLCLVVKAFLREHGLNEVFTGERCTLPRPSPICSALRSSLPICNSKILTLLLNRECWQPRAGLSEGGAQ